MARSFGVMSASHPPELKPYIYITITITIAIIIIIIIIIVTITIWQPKYGDHCKYRK